jgi:hypothetical protein
LRKSKRDSAARAADPLRRWRPAAALGGLGVSRGDSVAFLGLNSVAFFEILFACGKAGAPGCWSSTSRADAPERRRSEGAYGPDIAGMFAGRLDCVDSSMCRPVFLGPAHSEGIIATGGATHHGDAKRRSARRVDA